jgi:diacylglycerol kinase
LFSGGGVLHVKEIIKSNETTKNNLNHLKKISLKKRLASFRYAFNGLKILVKEEHNARIHLFIACFVLLAGFILKISIGEWFAVIFCIGWVFVTEFINTAIENTVDIISKEKNEKIKKIKDLSAGAVLVAATVSAVIGLIIFLPKIVSLGNF